PGAVGAQEIDPLAAAIELLRPVRDVARDRTEPGVDEQVDGAPFLVAPNALVDDVREAGEPAPLRLLRETADLGLDDLVGLSFEVSERRPVDEREERQDGCAEQRHVDERELKDRRAE